MTQRSQGSLEGLVGPSLFLSLADTDMHTIIYKEGRQSTLTICPNSKVG